MTLKIRIPLSTHFGNLVVIDVHPGEVRKIIAAPPCEVCGGRGLLDLGEGLDRCSTCEATGLALTFEREASS